MYDLIIIGGGPAGTGAGVYAARKRVKSLLITEDFGGQSVVSPDVQNFIGIVSLPGTELSKRFKEHLDAYKDDVLEIKEHDKAEEVKETEGGFEVKTRKGETYKTRAVLVGAGGRRRKLPTKGADRLDNKGVVYCASCDAPLFKGMKTVVIGGGNAGFEAAQQLLEYSPQVTLLEKADEVRADPSTVHKVQAHENFKLTTGVDLLEIKGDKFVEGVVFKDKEGQEHEIDVQGVFVEIGSIPNSDMVKNLVDLDDYGQIIVDHKTARTSREGIWAAGDVTDVPYKQNNISMGDGVKALEDIYIWLNKSK